MSSPASQAITRASIAEVVGDNEPAPRCRDGRGTGQLAQGVGHRVVEKLQSIKVALPDEGPGGIEVEQVVARQSLYLDKVSGKPPGTPRPVELDEATRSPVRARDVAHSQILLRARFREIPAQLEDFFDRASGGVEGSFDISLRQRVDPAAVGGQPVLQSAYSRSKNGRYRISGVDPMVHRWRLSKRGLRIIAKSGPA